MPERNDDRARVQTLLQSPDRFDELTEFLVQNSRLPGPRGNLELAKVFADEVAASGGSGALWNLLREWLTISSADAPTGNPREFLPFCALQGLGALYIGADAARRREILAMIRGAASDDRWRTREGAAIALQRIGLRSFADLEAIVEEWMPSGTLLEQRAILAALAEPPVLRAPGAPHYALQVCQRLLETARGLDADSRTHEAFRVLRQALEYGISVIVAASPEEGFSRMRAWARDPDPVIQRILRVNLGKARLATRHVDDVRRVEEAMGRGR